MTTPPRPPGSPFGPREFQLVLLRRMADHRPELVEDAVRELGASKAEMREANKAWQARVRGRGGPQGLALYRAALGAPEQTVERRIGDLTATGHLWRVPLWPELRFEALTGPGAGPGQVWNAWLVRRPGGTPPAPRTLAELAPWSAVVDDVARAFPPARPLEGSAPTRGRLAFTAPGDGGAPTRCEAHFVWGLLQDVTSA